VSDDDDDDDDDDDGDDDDDSPFLAPPIGVLTMFRYRTGPTSGQLGVRWSGGLVVWWSNSLSLYSEVVVWWSGGLVIWWSGGLVVWWSGFGGLVVWIWWSDLFFCFFSEKFRNRLWRSIYIRKSQLFNKEIVV